MAKRILGIDTGTNSLGWAIVDYNEEAIGDKYTLIDKGVNIFQEGVKLEKGVEESKAAERTEHKHQRLNYWRRKVRKIKLLKILCQNHLCPPLESEELKRWRSEKVYPTDELFMEWQRTDDNYNKNPYYYRNLCLTKKLDMTDLANRYIVGRAIYHINQRRGFLSNRKETTKESDGAVSKGIDELTKGMQEYDCEYLGQYFYRLYQEGKRIRNHYTSRIAHYERELLAICSKQGLGDDLTEELRKTIINQRPLKSQKQSVGKCVFEPKKPRCPMSHPLYEEYRLFAFINNIKIQTPHDVDLRQLTDEEKQAILPLFLRKSKPNFDFKEIAAKLSGTKNNFCYYKDQAQKAYRFNYYMDTSVSGCPVIAHLSEAFDADKSLESWLDTACERYTQGDGKTRYEIMNDIWHTLFFFEDEDHLETFAKKKLQMDDEHAKLFAKIKMTSDYASLSLKAIRKILPYMKEYGMIYSHAVFLANLPYVIGCNVDKEALLPILPKEDADDIVKAFYEYDPKKTEIKTQEEYVKSCIANKYNLSDKESKLLKKLYHPSMIETFPRVLRPEAAGYFQLQSPRTSSMRNPMAMHSLFRLRHVVNTLLREGKIDEYTTIRIEFARELNDANKRAAVRQWQNERDKQNKAYAQEIKELMGNNYEPTQTDILKYRLWEEQGHICLYTGDKINAAELFEGNRFDIEHTIPRSVGGDSTNMNLTVCQSRFNREVKRDMIPTELPNHDLIIERIATWKEKYEELGKQIRKCNTRGVVDKDMKDRIIQKRHRLILEQDYWRGKYQRFEMTDVPEGFSRRQGVDISVISKYARLYLRTVFREVYIVKGIATADFRKIWGLQEEYEKKQRVNHCHHTIDAITIACIGKAEYDKLASYYRGEELYHWGLDSKRAVYPKPWATFTEDVKRIEQTLLVSHYTADNVSKTTRKKIHKNGKFTGQYMQGDTARGALHLDTYYGAIERDGEIRYVVRKPLDQIEPKTVECIVDEAVKEKIKAAIAEHGNLKKAVEAGIWMNREKGVKINKVRIFANSVKRPLNIRKHRDVSNKEYKRTFHVTNDTNYAMGIYVGYDKKGKAKRDFELINTLDAVTFYNSGVQSQGLDLLPTKSKNGYPLKWRLRVGRMVLLYENSPEEIFELDKRELAKRLYKITGMSSMVVSGCSYGRLYLTYQQEARPSTEVKSKSGEYKQNEELRPSISLLHTQFHALIQGQDFEINDIGEITFLHR